MTTRITTGTSTTPWTVLRQAEVSQRTVHRIFSTITLELIMFMVLCLRMFCFGPIVF